MKISLETTFDSAIDIELPGKLRTHSLGSSRTKKTVKKADIVCKGGRGVNPSSLIKPKITGFSNHSEMAFGHHNMNDKA